MQLTPLKKLPLQCVAVAGLIVVIFLVTKACTLHTASFGKADTFIRTNSIVATALGPIDASSLKSYKFEMCRQGASCARFEIVATGHVAKGLVQINLQKDDSTWSVTSASLVLPNGNAIVLK
jgi:hypothetical protein